MIRIDTHVAVWLYTGESDKISARGRELLDRTDRSISPMVQLELDLLHEIGRLRVPGRDIVSDLIARIGLTVSSTTFAAVTNTAGGLSWTRDPFGRLIAADAIAANCQLLTKDQTIRQNCDLAIW